MFGIEIYVNGNHEIWRKILDLKKCSYQSVCEMLIGNDTYSLHELDFFSSNQNAILLFWTNWPCFAVHFKEPQKFNQLSFPLHINFFPLLLLKRPTDRTIYRTAHWSKSRTVWEYDHFVYTLYNTSHCCLPDYCNFCLLPKLVWLANLIILNWCLK